ncbi:hypothetical protein BDV97DRAFT_371439 [Delphinella strobiligena]|nr:hypothetical protein BDV97DRAFT_371439 [Delphinella strobiligena]
MEQWQEAQTRGRSNNTLPKISIPSRRTTDTLSKSSNVRESSKKREGHHHHLHRRHHRHHHTRDTIQSAVQLQNPFSFDSLRRSHHNHNSSRPSPEQSRQGSLDAQRHSTEIQHAEAEDAIKPIERIIRPDHVVKERNRREQRAEEVSEALNALSKDAHTATRKLDDTYYALLERTGTLKATIASLQDLSTHATETRKEWREEVSIGKEKIEAKIESFANFEAQEQVVEELVWRLKNAKDRAAELEQRLETCRGRLEGFQQKEQESRRKINKRWKLCWLSLSLLVLAVILLIVWRQRRGDPPLLTDLRGRGEALRDRGADLAVEVGITDKQRFNKTKPGMRLVDQKYEKQKVKEEDHWKRLLDEL